MKKSLYKTTLITSLLSHLLAFVLLIFYSIFTFEGKNFLPAFILDWVWNNTISLYVANMIVIQCGALLLTYSLLLSTPRNKIRVNVPFHELVSTSFSTIIVLTIFYTIALMWFKPSVDNRILFLKNSTTTAGAFRDIIENDYKQAKQQESVYESATDARKQEIFTQLKTQFHEALYYSELYLRIDPSDIAIQKTVTDIKKRGYLSATQTGGDEARQTFFNFSTRQNQNSEDLLNIAKKYYQAQDFFTAHYYANLAFRLDPSKLEAKTIANLSWDRIVKLSSSIKEQEQQQLFIRKKKGFEYLNKGEFIRAYYQFKTLNHDYPLLDDVKEYLKIASREVEKIAFFCEEAGQLLPFSGYKDIAFINKNSDNEVEFIYFKKLVKISEELFVFGVEALQINGQGKVIYHLKAPYGKIMDNHLFLLCIAKDRAHSDIGPYFLKQGGDKEMKNILSLTPTPNQLIQLSQNRAGFTAANFITLMNRTKTYKQFGLDSSPFQIESLNQIAYPFQFLILSLFSISLGWMLKRNARKELSFFSFFSIPLIFMIAFLLIHFYLFLYRVLLIFLLFNLGYWMGLLVQIAVLAVLFISALFVLALQKTA